MIKRKSILLLITYSCNLKCVYCYEPKRRYHRMTPQQAKDYVQRVVDNIEEEYEEFDVQFMGGEPLLEFELIKEMTDWLWSHDFKVPLAGVFAPTNGTLLNDEMKAWFTENKERICLGLSFDGNRLMQNINRSESATDVDVDFFVKTWPDQSVKMTISPDTIGQLADGVKALHQYGFKEILADLAMGANVGWHEEHLRIYAEQLNILKDWYLEHPEIPPASILGMRFIDGFNLDAVSKKCGCGESFICIDHDGQQYACHLFAPITASQEQAQQSLQIDFKDHSRFLSKVCSECLLSSVCNICHGMNYLCNGDVSIQSPFTCQAFKIQFFVCCELNLKKAMATGDEATSKKIRTILSYIKKNYEN